MSNGSESKNDPILGISTKTMKNDILIFKNEALKDLKESQLKVSQKYSNLDLEIKEKLNAFENRITIYESKIIELSKLIDTDKTIREKVDKLIEFKEKADESMLTERIRLDNFRNDLYNSVNRIDQILKDSVIYPGIIGGISKFKTFHDLIDYVLTQCSQNLTFREKSIIDFKSYKTKLESAISTFNTQINSVLNTTSEFTKKCVKECEERMKSIYNIYDDRLQDTRVENANYAIGLEKATDVLKKELENLYVVKNELYEKVDKGIEEVKDDNTRVTKLFIGYKKGFHLLQYKFTQLSEFIKDVRFRINLNEEVKRREYTHMADMINFDKRKKGFMDGVNRNYLKKDSVSQLKDYINGKITVDEIFKKRDTLTSKNSENNINSPMNEAYKRKSLIQPNKINFTESIKTNYYSAMRGSVALPRNLSLDTELLKNFHSKINKEEIKEEDEEYSSSRRFIDVFKEEKIIPKKLKEKINENVLEENKQEKKEENKKTNNDENKLIKKEENKTINKEENIEHKKEIKIEKSKEENKDEKKEEKNKIMKKENSKLQIISKDKEKDKIETPNKNMNKRTSLKNVIQDIFNVKNLMDNIKNKPLNENKTNKSERKISNHYNSNNNISENGALHSDIKNETNNSNNINSSQTLKNKNMSDSNILKQNWNTVIKKIEIKNDTKNNNRENIRVINGEIKKKLISPNFNNKPNSMINNNSSKILNPIKEKNIKDNNTKKTINSTKSYNSTKKEVNKTGNFFLNKYVDKKDINIDKNNYLLIKKKNLY